MLKISQQKHNHTQENNTNTKNIKCLGQCDLRPHAKKKVSLLINRPRLQYMTVLYRDKIRIVWAELLRGRHLSFFSLVL